MRQVSTRHRRGKTSQRFSFAKNGGAASSAAPASNPASEEELETAAAPVAPAEPALEDADDADDARRALAAKDRAINVVTTPPEAQYSSTDEDKKGKPPNRVS